ncbi:MAG: DUF993 family protein [Planctomycetota bacterium]
MARLPGARTMVFDDEVLAPYDAGVDASEPLPRRAYAAAHIAMRDGYAHIEHASHRSGTRDEIASAIDWEATLGFRRRLDALGMGVAEAMDTAQRFDVGWDIARELIERTGELGLRNGFVGAASSDHVASIGDLDALADAISEQVAYVRTHGGLPIVLPQPWLTENGASEDDYVRVYTRVIDASEGELLLHWLGEVFHPSMRGYFPGDSVGRILAHDPEKVRGIKMSLLDRAFEERLRADLAARGQVVFTGDDHNFAALIEGTSQEPAPLAPLDGRPLPGGAFSHALLGIFAAVARPASLALRRLGVGDVDGYRALMEPCEELGRIVFEAPVGSYKAGVAFLAWLNGLQSNPMLPNHAERERDLDHFLRVAEAASRAGAIEDAALASERLQQLVGALSPDSRERA